MNEILVILALILLNGLLSGAEIAIVAVRPSRLEELQRTGRSSAAAAKRLREQPERFLATVQIGITVAAAAAAAFGGASLADDLAAPLAALPLVSGWAEELAFALVVGGISFLSIVLGELVPKSLALRVSERYALLAARPLLALSQLARPVVWVLTASSNAVLRLFGDRTTFTEARLSLDELRSVVSDAGRLGTMQAEVSDIATRALDFGELAAADVMIHRRFVVALPRDASGELVRGTFEKQGHQRLPVYVQSLDNVVGYLSWRDVLTCLWQGRPVSVEALVRPALFVPEGTLAVDLLHEMREKRTHLAIVVDEHGGMEGIVTLEDLLEELVGEIHSEHATPAGSSLVREPGGTFVVPGLAAIREVNRETGLGLDEPEEVSTIGGLCVQLNEERMPAKGDVLVVSDGTRIEILDASPRRVRSVRLRPPSAAAGALAPAAAASRGA
jgi:putative hemolysin